jgi:hypothetical protein
MSAKLKGFGTPAGGGGIRNCSLISRAARLIKELFELHLTKSVAMTQEEIKKEKEKEETVDWMTRWLKDQAKDLERP